MEGALRGRRILVAEDEYFIAEEVAEALAAAGVSVAGPVARVAEALALVRRAEPLDAAVLDVNLWGEMAWPVAEALAARGVPTLLATGYDAGIIPPAHAGLPRVEKPLDARAIVLVLARLVA